MLPGLVVQDFEDESQGAGLEVVLGALDRSEGGVVVPP